LLLLLCGVAEHTAIKAVFGDIRVRVCYFHVSRNVDKTVSEYMVIVLTRRYLAGQFAVADAGARCGCALIVGVVVLLVLSVAL